MARWNLEPVKWRTLKELTPEEQGPLQNVDGGKNKDSMSDCIFQLEFDQAYRGQTIS